VKVKIYASAKMRNPSHKPPYILYQSEIVSRTVNKMKKEKYQLSGIATNPSYVTLYFEEMKNMKPIEGIYYRKGSNVVKDYIIDEGDTMPADAGDFQPIDTNNHGMTWDDIKRKGSKHYKAGKIEPIDMYRDIKPHQSLSTLDIKALSDIIKYAYRMLTNGSNTEDCNKIIHYTEMVRFFSKTEKPKR